MGDFALASCTVVVARIVIPISRVDFLSANAQLHRKAWSQYAKWGKLEYIALIELV